ncbi:MAG: hypothetical protein QM528_00730 [Phycisphaerales bacterium]|nr:hypothetical protein [Phycisphaerales bacterium]
MKSIKISHIFFILIFCIACQKKTDTPGNIVQNNRLDSLGLVSIYNQTGGDDWAYNTNWLTKAPIDQWYGVEVENGRVVSIILIDNALNNVLNFPGGDTLSNLQELYLFNNILDGFNIPANSLNNLRKLNLYYNQLTSFLLPSNSLNSLTSLNISNNSLTSFIIQSNSLNNLVFLDLAGNNIASQGTFVFGNDPVNTVKQIILTGNNYYVDGRLALEAQFPNATFQW